MPAQPTMTIDTSRVVKLLAERYHFDETEGAHVIAASQSDRTDKRDFLQDLAVAESKDDAKAKVKRTRAPSGWLLFCAEMRVMSAHSSPRGGLKLCDRWREMTQEQRAVWNDKAAVIKDAIKRGEKVPHFAQNWRRPKPCVSDAEKVAREGEVWRSMVYWRTQAELAQQTSRI